MREIKYTITSFGAYLTEIVPESSDTVAFKLKGADDAILKIGKKIYEISHGVCYIRPCEIGDGLYVPELITDSDTFTLDTFAVSLGILKLKISERELTKIECDLLNLCCRVRELEERDRKLHDAVFGTKLF